MPGSPAAGPRCRRSCPGEREPEAIVRGSGRIGDTSMPTKRIGKGGEPGIGAVSSRRPCRRRADGRRAARERPRTARRRGHTRSRAPSVQAGTYPPRPFASSTAPFIAPTPRKPRITSGALSTAQPRAVSTQPSAPTPKPRDDGNPPEPVHQPSRRQRGERPGRDEDRGPAYLIPVTRTSVIVATATASWSTPERSRRQSESRTVLRRTGCEMAVIEQFNQPRPELLRAAV